MRFSQASSGPVVMKLKSEKRFVLNTTRKRKNEKWKIFEFEIYVILCSMLAICRYVTGCPRKNVRFSYVTLYLRIKLSNPSNFTGEANSYFLKSHLP